jgi:hypothetical protein
MKVLFVAGFGPIVHDRKLSLALYRDTFGINFEELEDGYFHTDAVEGVKHFALWPLSQAAQSCFGEDTWPSDIPTPQAWIEFDVEDIKTATFELAAKGYRLLVSAKEEPWGQTVTRFVGPEGLLVGVTHTPSLRGEED